MGKPSPPAQKDVFKQLFSCKPPRKHTFESSRGLGEQLSLFSTFSLPNHAGPDTSTSRQDTAQTKNKCLEKAVTGQLSKAVIFPKILVSRKANPST